MEVEGRIKDKVREEVGRRGEKGTSACPENMTETLLHLHFRSQERTPAKLMGQDETECKVKNSVTESPLHVGGFQGHEFSQQ